MATRVLPSPVFISAMAPLWSTAPPMSCTSKCRMLSTRRPASRTTANASGMQVVQRLALGQPLAEFRRLGAKLLVRERL